MLRSRRQSEQGFTQSVARVEPARPWLRTGEAEFRLPGIFRMGDLPAARGDALRVKSSTCNDLSGDRQARHANAVWFQIGLEHRCRRAQRRFAQRNGRERRDRMVGNVVGWVLRVLAG